jgi:hypothetical protein
MNKEESINYLEKERGFNITNMKEVLYTISDEELNLNINSEQELIDFAQHQKDCE